MGAKSITYVAVFSGVMGLLAAVVSLVSTLQAVVYDKASGGSSDAAVGLVALAFVAICLLGVCAAAALKKQADEIMVLRRQLSRPEA